MQRERESSFEGVKLTLSREFYHQFIILIKNRLLDLLLFFEKKKKKREEY